MQFAYFQRLLYSPSLFATLSLFAPSGILAPSGNLDMIQSNTPLSVRPAHGDDGTASLGIVIIGRNEGERLVRCLESVSAAQAPVIYVDSGSTDGSCEEARSRGATVVALDMTIPFTAARARNEGFSALYENHPQLDYVFFVDGDCEVVPGWTGSAIAHLEQNSGVAIVCGRRRERRPDASIYNEICDAEWNTPVGEALSCGGDSVMRMAAVKAVGGFDSSLIAHEEPELSARLRAQGWTIHRIQADMTLHDADITKLGQVWKRSRRGGFGYTQVLSKNPKAADRSLVMLVMRPLFWAIGLPLAIIFAAFFWVPALALLPIMYIFQIARVAVRTPGRIRYKLSFALLSLFAKFAEAFGILEFAYKRILGLRMDAIVYKSA